MGNKNVEKECINKVLRYSKSQHGKSKKIINLLNGFDIERDFDERPDFVKKVNDIDGSQIVLGIEHFQVDGVCIKRKNNGKYAGTEQKRLLDTKTIYNKYHDQIVENNEIRQDVFDSAIKEILDISNKNAEFLLNSTYNDFINNFRQKLNSHSKNFDEYLKTLKKYRENNEKTKLMLLIDVVGCFSGMILNSNKSAREIAMNEIPLFSDVVSSLISSTANKVDYIILCLGSKNKTKVIALETNNIYKELQKQKIKVYNYYCYDCFFPFMTEAKCSYEIVEKTKDKYKINVSYTGNRLDEKVLMRLVLHCYYLCYSARKQKKSFVTNNSIQLLLDVFSKYLVTWKVYNNGNVKTYFPIFDIKNATVLKQEISEFEELWSIHDD